jgi:hypothetical protein
MELAISWLFEEARADLLSDKVVEDASSKSEEDPKVKKEVSAHEFPLVKKCLCPPYLS